MYRQKLVLFLCLILPLPSYASFIETTLGTAVVNDATAAYFNPAALMLMKNAQIIPLGTMARFQTQFAGQSTTVLTGFTQTGTSYSTSYYYSPSFYAGLPVNERITLGFAVVSNFANRNPEENSILRYTQASNTIQDYDVVPSIGVRLNKYFSLGGGINFSYVNFQLHPIIGFPGSNIADSQGYNQSDGSGVGANAGLLLQPAHGTLIGFDYRTVTVYSQSGTSVIEGATPIASHHYHFKMRTPARSVFSISQRITPSFGMITTIQRIQWSMIRNIHIYNIATLLGNRPAIIDASIPYYMHNTWLFTLGGNYRFNPDWIIRIATTYNQSPNNRYYQMGTGDSYILGVSVGYTVNKTFTLDGSYAHAFTQNQTIHIAGNRYLIDGSNRSSRDVVSLKLTVNL